MSCFHSGGLIVLVFILAVRLASSFISHRSTQGMKISIDMSGAGAQSDGLSDVECICICICNCVFIISQSHEHDHHDDDDHHHDD